MIGTLHFYQQDEPKIWNTKCGVPLFAEYVCSIISREGIDYLFEEMSIDYLTRTFAAERYKSWLEIAGKKWHIKNAFIDPGDKERNRIGITRENVKTPIGIVLRERYWLEQIDKCSFSTALCVIGAAHIESFSALLSQTQKYEVVIENPYYNPMNLKTECAIT